MVVAPDTGRAKFAKKLGDKLGADLAIMHKTIRLKPSRINFGNEAISSELAILSLSLISFFLKISRKSF